MLVGRKLAGKQAEHATTPSWAGHRAISANRIRPVSGQSRKAHKQAGVAVSLGQNINRAARREGMSPSLSVLWALVPVVTLGFGTGFSFSYAAFRLRSWMLGPVRSTNRLRGAQMAMICDFRRLFWGLLNRCCEEAYTRPSLP